MPNVAFVRPELAKLLPLYVLIGDTIEGETAVKAKGTTYLPMPNAADTSKENRARYNAYLQRAVFYNVARRTLLGLVGQVFMRDPEIEVPPELEKLVANATGEGVSLTLLSKRALNFNLAYSRGGLFIDHPVTEQDDGEGGVSKQELEEGNIRPTMYVYPPTEGGINWRTIERGAEEILSLVVIFETYAYDDDGFELKQAAQFRVLRLDAEGLYVHEIWREPSPTPVKTDGGKLPKGNFQLYKKYFPTLSDGSRMDFIPFTFFGGENNDPEPDNPSFYDMSSLNLAHYRNSADYEEACYITGQPTPVATGLTEEWVSNVLKNTLNFGSRGGIMLPAGADAKLLQAQESTMLKEAMDAKERQMVAIGARLVEQKDVQRTATEANLESASQGSTLSTAAKNVSEAFNWGLKVAAKWIGIDESKVSFKLNSDLDINKMSYEERKQLLEEWTKGAITFEEMRAGLRKAGSATEDDKTAKTAIAKDTADAMAMEQSFIEPSVGGE